MRLMQQLINNVRINTTFFFLTQLTQLVRLMRQLINNVRINATFFFRQSRLTGPQAPLSQKPLSTKIDTPGQPKVMI